MSGKVVHFEIPVDDRDRASAFYGGAFGWQLNSMPDMGYTLVSTGPATDAAFCIPAKSAVFIFAGTI